MHNELRNKLIKDIKKTGFPLEINSSITLNKNKWFVLNNVSYFDEGIKNFKEVDIVATKNSHRIKSLKHTLVIECKKSSLNPWIFFKQDIISVDVINMNIASLNDHASYKFFSNFITNHHYSKDFLCTYYMVSNTPSDSKLAKTINNAINQVMGALFFYLIRERNYLTKYNLNELSVIYPIIVLEGELFSAYVEGEDIKLQKEDHVRLQLQREFPEAIELIWNPRTGQRRLIRTKPFIIDVVKKEYFETFLKNFE